MKLRNIAILLCILPGVAFAAARSGSARVGVGRTNVPVRASGAAVQPSISESSESNAIESIKSDVVAAAPAKAPEAKPKDCRTAYRACMDEFCLLGESEGYRCACSDSINKSKSLIKEIQDIQKEADKLFTEGVAREELGAKAALVFGESDSAKKSSRLSGINFSDWLNSGDDETALDSDEEIGDTLYSIASDYCASELEACGSKAEMEEMLYSRQVVADCKEFSSYLADQKSNAEANKRTAESAVRKARAAMLDTTNKYNRGECLLAYKACIADKGGCGVNFENCLDEDLLQRRAYSCNDVLNQCMADREYVLQDWQAEKKTILADAAEYADKNRRGTCLAKIQNCLEEDCATSTDSMCLNDVNVAAGVCPIITECEELIPGIRSVINDKLVYLRTSFCQNDIDACLRDKCGQDFTAPECLGKKASQIAALCPQSMYPSCKNEKQFDIIVSSILLEMDYKMLDSCINHFADKLSAVCGTDMACLPEDTTILALQKYPNDARIDELQEQVLVNADAAVDEFFKQFENDITVSACLSSQQPKGSSKKSLGDSIFNSAKMIAKISAENRSQRLLDTKLAELSRQEDLAKAEKNCNTLYKPGKPKKDEKNYTYIKSVSFEPSLRNCHVCRVQQVCEVGGESKATSALKAAAGGLSAGAAAGTMINAGWGTAIGGVVGAVGAGLVGMASGGEKEFCQEIESCEDVNM